MNHPCFPRKGSLREKQGSAIPCAPPFEADLVSIMSGAKAKNNPAGGRGYFLYRHYTNGQLPESLPRYYSI